MNFQEEILALNGGVLEFETLVQLWAKNMVLTTHERGRGANVSAYGYDISWNKVKIRHQEAQFNDAARPPSPKAQVLFRSTYTNESDREQQNNFRAERETRSSADLSVYEGVCLPIDKVHVRLPGTVATANAGFPAELSVCTKDRKQWTETLKWSVDTQIQVEGRSRTHAEMVVHEKQWDGDFSIRTTVSGKVKVTVRDPNTGNLIRTLNGDIKEICRGAAQEGLDVAKMNVSGKEVVFVTNGHLHFRYGVEQNVKISKTEIDYE